MPPKKDLNAFLAKASTKKGKKQTTETKEEQKARDEQVDTLQNKNTTSTAKADSSDEEVDELDEAAKGLKYDNIKENKDISKGKNDDEKKGFGFEQEDKKALEK